MTEPTERRRQPQQTRTDVARTDVARTDGPPPSQAVQRMHQRQARVGELAQIVKASAATFQRLLPSHLPVEAFMSSAGAALWKSEQLMDGAVNDPEAFMIALREAASLGHIPGTDHYWLTPRKRGQRMSVLGIEGYQGIVERMFRAGGVLSVRCRTVRAHDTFEPDAGPNGAPLHQFGGKWGAFSTRGERGDVIGVYAYAILNGGMPSQVVLMGLEELMEHRAAATTKNVWDSWPEAMYRKTALRQLEPYVPVSVEYRTATAQHVAAIAAVAPTQPAPGRMEAEAGAESQDGDPGAQGPAQPVAATVGEARPGVGGVPVTNVQYDPAQWSPDADDPEWSTLPVTRPGEGVPPEVRGDA